MTNMNYEKKYEKLIDAVKVLRDNNQSDEGIRNWVNDNVPELREESELDGEKIRKEIILALEFANVKGVYDKHIAWLEKQGGQKSVEWSEESKNKIVELKTLIAKCNGFNKNNREKVFKMIDSLQPQSNWKPSKEQIDLFEFMIISWAESGTLSPYGCVYNSIMSLLNDLKKL